MVDPSTSAAATALPAPSSEAPGQPYYERERQRLKALLAKRQTLERNLQATEDAIYKKETEYLEDTPQGNIITGFDAYTKGSSVAPGGGRRRGQAQDMNRVFTRSSISFRTDLDSPAPTATSTPVAAAPTPVSTGYVKGDSASNHPTPTSASSANRTGAGAAGHSKKHKKGGEDSEGERDIKKVRTNFGAQKK
ncbi:Chromatin modification-related protein [Lachnellula occidentalis]|uniref:Chromatin modification-related protein EAF6 n=1 Tax=Lachnellula occidentalis TaxID=215460 RepID=A0A8H8RQN0_9HELO|nr:Chromatin modification-related protein [Lachnellula occidentalis]